jgi:hypothetical protein
LGGMGHCRMAADGFNTGPSAGSPLRPGGSGPTRSSLPPAGRKLCGGGRPGRRKH